MADLPGRDRNVQGVQVTWALLVMLAGAIAFGIWAARGWLHEKDATTAAEDLLRGERALNAEQAIQIRSLSQQLAQAKTLTAIAQKQRNDATEAKTKATVEKIKAATPKEAAKLINETSPEPAVVVDIRTGGPITELK